VAQPPTRLVRGAWIEPHELENRAAALLALAAAAALQWTLAGDFVSVRPRWLIPAAEMAFVVVLLVLDRGPRTRVHRVGRMLGLSLVALVSLDNAVSAVLLDASIVTRTAQELPAPTLLASGAGVYMTNIIAFGLWYWEVDRGGPIARAQARRPYPEWLFPQMAAEGVAPRDWRPTFVDYLYVSLTNAMAFSPTDTLPLSVRAKALMGLQSVVALSTSALVVARAINILG
jgi:hypothetical protein